MNSHLFPCQMQRGDDWLSKLPDDILLAIVERLDSADAVRTSIFSRRWKQIPAMLSKIDITVDHFERLFHRSNTKLPYYDPVRLDSTIIEATRGLLGSRAANLYTIRHLRMKFYLRSEERRVGKECLL